MEKLYIICVEDQREVLHAIEDQLTYFSELIEVEACESAAEAKELLDELDSEGSRAAVIISDHVMPNQTGVELLTELKSDFRFQATKKVLLTGQATHMDTISAINHAAIDNYIEKPWEQEDLIEKVSVLLTEYIIGEGIAYEPYMPVLDKTRLFELLR